MKRLSLQCRITIMTALLTCAACVLTNCLVGYTGMRYMDAIGSNISAFNATGEDSPQAFDPTKATPDDKVTIVVNDAQESFGATTWCITAGVTLLGGVLAYFVSGRALKPLRAFAAQVERVQPDNLSEIRLSEDVPTELQRCSASFNDKLARLGVNDRCSMYLFSLAGIIGRHQLNFLQKAALGKQTRVKHPLTGCDWGKYIFLLHFQQGAPHCLFVNVGSAGQPFYRAIIGIRARMDIF